MTSFKNISSAFAVFLMSMIFMHAFSSSSVIAEEQGETIIKSKTINILFDEKTPEGNVDLKKIAAEELNIPRECEEATVVCQIKSVGFDMKITKEWVKVDLQDLNNYSFAKTAPRLENPIDLIDKGEVVILQEVLDRRGLLTYLDGSPVQERGFFGSLTWMGLIRLAQVKGLSDKDPEFTQELTDHVNELLDNMANDIDYVKKRALPREDLMVPHEGDDLKDLWDHYTYLSKLAQDSKRVDPGVIPLNIGKDVNIDGFFNVKRTE